MNKINIDNWKEFAMSDLGFKNYHGKRLKKSDRLEGDIPFITAGKENQGVVGCIGNDMDTYENPITIDMFGNVFYHEGIFAGDDNIYFFVNPKLNKYQKLFIVGALHRFIHSVFAYIDQFRQDNADRLSVFLPSTQSGEPDFQYMEEYIKNIEELQNCNLQIIKLLLPPPDKSVNTESWKHFKVSELFKVISGKGITKQEIFEHAGELPAIQSGENNFGCIGYLDYNYCVSKKYAISKGECLTVARSGSSGFVGYQPKQCVVGDSAKILEPKFEANTNRLLYIRALLMVNKSLFAYTDKVTTSNYENSTIPLPVTQSGEPDFQYMEQTITALIVQQQAKLQLTQTTFA